MLVADITEISWEEYQNKKLQIGMKDSKRVVTL